MRPFHIVRVHGPGDRVAALWPNLNLEKKCANAPRPLADLEHHGRDAVQQMVRPRVDGDLTNSPVSRYIVATCDGDDGNEYGSALSREGAGGVSLRGALPE